MSTASPRAVRCVVADSSVYFTEGLSLVLEGRSEVVVVGCAHALHEVPALIRRVRPDVVLVGFEPPTASIELVRGLPDVAVVILSAVRRRDDVIAAVLAGASGLASKDIPPGELAALVRDVAAGRISLSKEWLRAFMQGVKSAAESSPVRRGTDTVALTPREREVVQLVVEGQATKVLAGALGIAPQTAKNHLHNVMAKVGAESRTQLCAWALNHGFRD